MDWVPLCMFPRLGGYQAKGDELVDEHALQSDEGDSEAQQLATHEVEERRVSVPRCGTAFLICTQPDLISGYYEFERLCCVSFSRIRIMYGILRIMA